MFQAMFRTLASGAPVPGGSRLKAQVDYGQIEATSSKCNVNGPMQTVQCSNFKTLERSVSGAQYERPGW